ncbi:hypothetical protein M0813_18111 [Anaeramoeba flamelloides]|uniref:PPM-type phosphatase domain-containing protein n=1 Tax=Anaeramoeba flamelloides TaxID=1746091 RepID=A0ABQ8YTN7_9EUKA|nr:hypothetical protein M0813_18111 [Anaeramoeba flamelloides]
MGPVLSRKAEVTSEILDLSGLQITKLPTVFDQCSKLRELDLSRNEIKYLPRGLTKLTNLTHFDWSKNQIPEIPKKFFKLVTLKQLNLSYNKIEALPLRISLLVNLTELDLGQNKIAELPPSLSTLTNLRTLSVFQNWISTLSGYSICKLPQLKELNLGGNQLTALPPAFSRLQSLETLFISYNNFSEFPNAPLRGLNSLTSLSCSSNSLTNIPDSIGYLTSLQQLDLRTNQLAKISTCLCELLKLTTINFSRNQLTELPEIFSQLTSLTELDLSYNSFKSFPLVLNRLTTLKRLTLRSNQIKFVNCSLDSLNNLFDLDLSNNCLTRLPESFFSGLLSLAVLSIKNNKLKLIPSSISILQQLLVLDLSQNEIQLLTSQVTSLESLIDLDLSFNKFEHFPKEILHLTNLSKLKLKDNKLKKLNVSLAEMPNLTELHLSGNKFEIFPNEVCSLPRLETLFLGGNKILMLPSCLAMLTYVQIFDVSSNNISFISDGIGFMRSLTHLNLSDNNISELPESFFRIDSNSNFTNICVDLSFNNLTKCSRNWKKFTNCKELDLSHNKIEYFETGIFESFAGLEVLKLSYNQSKDLDLSYTESLPSLKILHIEGNSYSKPFQKLLTKLTQTNKPKQKNKTPKSVDIQTKNNGDGKFSFNTIIQNPKNFENQQNSFYSLEELLVNHEIKDSICRPISFSGNRFSVNYSEIKGQRKTMEDAIDIKMKLDGKENASFFAVYDGHGGRKTAELAANTISKMFIKELKGLYKINSVGNNYTMNDSKQTKELKKYQARSKSEPIFQSMLEPKKKKKFIIKTKKIFHVNKTKTLKIPINSLLKKNNNNNNKNKNEQEDDLNENNQKEKKINKKLTKSQLKKLTKLKRKEQEKKEYEYIFQIFKKVFQKFNAELIKTKETSGSTAVIIFVYKKQLYCGNIGDSRAVMCRRGMAVRMSVDHKPNLPKEKERIIKNGGIVTEDSRINSGLAVSRSFGDYKFQPYISAKPFVTKYKMTKNDRYIVLGCDGLWDVVTDEMVVDILLKNDDPEKAAVKIRNYAISLETSDNISVIVIDLQPELNKKNILEKMELKKIQFQKNEKLLSKLIKNDKKEFNHLIKEMKETIIEQERIEKNKIEFSTKESNLNNKKDRNIKKKKSRNRKITNEKNAKSTNQNIFIKAEKNFDQIKIDQQRFVKSLQFFSSKENSALIDSVKKVLLKSARPTIYTNEFCPNCDFCDLSLSKGAKKLLETENAGGSSIISEALSFEVLHRLFRCKLLATEMEIQYKDPHSPITDYAISIDGQAFGVSVTRAMKWPIGSTFTTVDGTKLLKKKLSGIIKSTKNAMNPKFEKQILHIWAENSKTNDTLIDIWENDLCDSLKSNTFILITTAENNCEYIFWNKPLQN